MEDEYQEGQAQGEETGEGGVGEEGEAAEGEGQHHQEGEAGADEARDATATAAADPACLCVRGKKRRRCGVM